MTCRRYRCVGCVAIVMVVPREVEPHRHYSRPAIALGLALWSLAAQPALAVRSRVSPWRVVGVTAATDGWAQLRRWARDGRAGRLFRAVGRRTGATLRQVAEQLAIVAFGHAPPAMRDRAREAQVFAGAVQMA